MNTPTNARQTRTTDISRFNENGKREDSTGAALWSDPMGPKSNTLARITLVHVGGQRDHLGICWLRKAQLSRPRAWEGKQHMRGKSLLVGGLLLIAAGGCTTYYKVTDPATNNVYYSTDVKQDGSTTLKDARTGNT